MHNKRKLIHLSILSKRAYCSRPRARAWAQAHHKTAIKCYTRRLNGASNSAMFSAHCGRVDQPRCPEVPPPEPPRNAAARAFSQPRFCGGLAPILFPPLPLPLPLPFSSPITFSTLEATSVVATLVPTAALLVLLAALLLESIAATFLVNEPLVAFNRLCTTLG